MDFKTRYTYNSKTDLLGRGGFAIVYKAHDTLLNRVVALKFFTNSGSDKHTLIAEISRAISLEHPNLCRYYDAAMLDFIIKFIKSPCFFVIKNTYCYTK